MRSSFMKWGAILSVSLFLLSILAFSFPYIKAKEEGTINIHWSNPKGLRLNGLEKGDKIHLEYKADSNLSVYLLTEDEADDYRRPLFYRTDLPSPEFTGKEGEFTIDIDKDADYEIMFLNGSFTTDHEVKYTLITSTQREKRISCISGSSLLLLSLCVIILIIVLKKRNG